MFLSIRHLLSRKKQSLLILMSITMGTASFVAFSGLMLAFFQFLKLKILFATRSPSPLSLWQALEFSTFSPFLLLKNAETLPS
jgi:hypothetical protein